MRLATTRIMAVVCIVGLVAACESSSSATTPPEVITTTSSTTTTVLGTTTLDAAPFHAIPADSLVVAGTATCSFSEAGVDPEGGPGFLVTCELSMSDPRVSGTETHDRFRFVNGGELGDVWIAEEATITNAEGTWRGSAQGADTGLPTGEAHYYGEGAYEGLEFHYYFDNDDSGVAFRGWISGGE